MRSLILTAGLFFNLLICSANAYLLEVVQSVPVETNLSVPGIRETQQVWVEMLNSAKSSIDLEQFYISHQEGQSLGPVLQALVSAAARGVQVRLIVDSKFFQNYSETPKKLAQLKNVQVRVLNYTVHGGVQHSKFLVIDRERSFVGSANFDWLALSHIHEVGLRIEDASIGSGLQSIFELDWSHANPLNSVKSQYVSVESGKWKEISSEPTSALLLGSPASDLPQGISPTINGLISILSKANRLIQIQVYQYSTKGNWQVLDQELRKAAARGVQVKLMVDQVALKNSGKELLALGSVKNIQVKSVLIPTWSGGAIPYSRLIHSKYFAVDENWSWIGTENWSEGYFTSCRNVGIIFQNKSLTMQLDQIFDRVWNSPYSRLVR